MRKLFESESRCVKNLFTKKWPDACYEEPKVLRESHSSLTGGNEWFNCDFALYFIDPTLAAERQEISMAFILPGTIGADLYLSVQLDDWSPAYLEFMGGGFFGASEFSKYIEVANAAIDDACAQMPLKSDVPRLKVGRRRGLTRVLVVEGDVTFLCLPDQSESPHAALSRTLVESRDRRIDVLLDNGRIIGLDGWVRIAEQAAAS